MLAMDEALKVMPERWWGKHKKNIAKWVQPHTLMIMHFSDQVKGCEV
jgi:hypothetical protein